MTAYTNHPDAIFDPNKPILGSTHLEARDNLIALAEGDPTAPNIYEALAAKLSVGAIGTMVLAYCESGNVSFGGLIAGSNLRPTSVWHGTTAGTAPEAIDWDGTTFPLAGTLAGTWMALGRYEQKMQIAGSANVQIQVHVFGVTLWQRTA